MAPTHAPSIDFAALLARLEQTERALRAGEGESPAARAGVLEARARSLAAGRGAERAETIAVFAFRVGGERYAVRLAEVEQVVESTGLVHLPGAPRAVLGALNVGGQVVVVVDPRQLLPLQGLSDLARVVVVRGGDGAFGLAVEAVEGRLELPASALGPALDALFSAVCTDGLALFDLAGLEDAAKGRPGP